MTNMFFYWVAGSVFAGLLALGLWPALRAYLKFRGTRLVNCPENRLPAAVEVDARHAADTAAFDGTDLRLRSCSRWPERQECGQVCLRQIEASPENCLVRNILTKWYDSKECVYCRKPLGEIHWHDHKPALRSPEGKSVEWFEVRPETLPSVLATNLPVCWNCHVAERFRLEYPELVVDRTYRHEA